jgi:RNA polymerase sigma factor (sigma-70 family)
VNDPSDADLIARVLQRGDERAYAGLVARHQEFLRHFLRRLTGNDHAAADDLAQETFIRAWRRLESYRGDAAWRSWLCGIGYRLFLARARRREPLDSAAEFSPDHEEAAPFSPPGLALDLEGAMDLLSSAERAAVTLCFQSGCSHEEAATALGIPLGTLKTHIFRAKEKLRRSLALWNPKERLKVEG